MRASHLLSLAAAAAAAALALLAPAAVHASPADTDAVPAPAAEPTWGLRGYSTQRWLGDASAAALTTDTLGGGGLAVERRLLALAVPGPFGPLTVSAELSWDAAAVDGTSFQQLDNHISTWSVNAGGRARLPVFSWLQVQGRAALGGGRTTVRIADQMSGAAISDRAVTLVTQTGLGLALAPRLGASRLRLGFEVEVGYQAATATGVRAYPEDRPEPELTIPAAYASLGDVDLDGWTLRLGAGVAF